MAWLLALIALALLLAAVTLPVGTVVVLALLLAALVALLASVTVHLHRLRRDQR